MTIQVSLILWTLICFVLFFIVLDRLLFRPMLSLMDARKERIRTAEAHRTDELRLREEQRQAALAEAQSRLEEEHNRIRAEAEQIRSEGKERLEDARKQRIAAVDAFRSSTRQTYETDMNVLAAGLNGIADRFAKQLLSQPRK